jgi:hypothetical protein
MPPLLLTYELYLRAAEQDEPRFEALTSTSDGDAMAAVRQMIRERNLRSVEVRRLGTHLFTLAA